MIEFFEVVTSIVVGSGITVLFVAFSIIAGEAIESNHRDSFGYYAIAVVVAVAVIVSMLLYVTLF